MTNIAIPGASAPESRTIFTVQKLVIGSNAPDTPPLHRVFRAYRNFSGEQGRWELFCVWLNNAYESLTAIRCVAEMIESLGANHLIPDPTIIANLMFGALNTVEEHMNKAADLIDEMTQQEEEGA
jgi:hypothetical protein